MRLRSASLDDVHIEALYVLDQRGGLVARSIRRLLGLSYRVESAIRLRVVRIGSAHI